MALDLKSELKRATVAMWRFLLVATAIGALEIYLYRTSDTLIIWMVVLPLAWVVTFVWALLSIGRRATWLLLTAPLGLWGAVLAAIISIGCHVDIRSCI